jgi:hypothetical protein
VQSLSPLPNSNSFDSDLDILNSFLANVRDFGKDEKLPLYNGSRFKRSEVETNKRDS